MNFLGNLLPLLANAANAAGEQGFAPQQPQVFNPDQRYGQGFDPATGAMSAAPVPSGRRDMGPGLSNYLGRVEGAIPQLGDQMEPIREALARNQQLGEQQQQERSDKGPLGGALKMGSGLRNVLGAIGDALLVSNGGQPVYRQRLERHRVGEAMSRLGQNPDDTEALERLYKISPELGMKAEDQLHQRRTRQREDASRTASADLLLGNDPTARERAIRADPEGYLTIEGKRSEATEKQLKSTRLLNDHAMQILGGVHDQASWERARRAATALYQRHGLGAEDMADLPDQYDPNVIREMQMRGMDTSKQLAAIARENKLDWDQMDDAEDNERAERNTDSLINDRRNKPKAGGSKASGGAKSEEALYADIMQRWTQGGAVNAREKEFVRSYETRKRSKGRSTGGGQSGRTAVIVNPKTGQRMKLEGGKWVPIK